MNNYKLYTTKGCIICNRVKQLIESQNLQIEVIQANELEIESFRKQGIRSFPVLKLNEQKYICGKEVGEYLAANLNELLKNKQKRLWKLLFLKSFLHARVYKNKILC